MSQQVERYIARRERALARVRELLVGQLKVRKAPEEIDPDAPLWGTGLGLDSIDAVELVVCLEEELGIRLPEDLTGRARMRTVNALVDLVLAMESADG